MSKIAVNPYLPLNEYIPDGEPRLFHGRVYVYGSHDQAGGNFFCPRDYVVWSAPEDNLGDWRCEGTAYRRGQDPADPKGERELFAPDVVCGPDGRYYLFYCLRMLPQFGVAVSDSPAGPFTFYGHIHYADGSLLTQAMPYDPSVLVDDDGRVYLYYGFSSEMLSQRFGVEVSPGAMVVELGTDMLTALTTPVLCVPWEGRAANTSFAGHAYFEAPSMRKIDGRYYLIYSSQWSRELCYAVSDFPDKDFVYGGVIVDNGDVGMQGRWLPVCMPGNNHGGLIKICGNWFIFYHRHTNGTSYSRQGCAEPVTFTADGKILQAEITTSGLNGAPLPAKGRWPAALACWLYCPAQQKMMLDFRNVPRGTTPYITEERTRNADPIQYLCNLIDGTVAGYKYFCGEANVVTLQVRGHANGVFRLYVNDLERPAIAQSNVDLESKDWIDVPLRASLSGRYALFLQYCGTGAPEVLSLTFGAGNNALEVEHQ